MITLGVGSSCCLIFRAADGGYLTIEVPCVESLPARMFGSSWSQVDAPRHLIHFTEPR